MRAHAPPHLRVLVDRASVVEETNILLEALPSVVRVGDSAPREHAGEDLRSNGVQARDDVLDERRAGGQREQLGQDVAEGIAHTDCAIGAANGDVHVDAEAVVPPDDVPEQLVVAAVVRRVDDPLVLPAAPRMCAGTGERDTVRIRERAELHATLRHPLRGLAERLAPARLHLDLGRDQLAHQMLVELALCGAGLEFLEPVRQLERLGIEERELLLDRDGQVVRVLERIARERDLLVRREPLRVSHATIVFEAALTAGSRRFASSSDRPPHCVLPVRARDARPAGARAARSACRRARARHPS